MCKKRSRTTHSETELLGLESPATVYRSSGCQFCNHTGYKGRIAIHEILYLDNNIKSGITSDMKSDDIRNLAVKNGMIELAESCKRLVLNGTTDITEFLSVNVQ